MAHNGAVYLFGGERGGLPLDDLWELKLGAVTADPSRGATWRRLVQKGAAPSGRYEHAAAVVAGTGRGGGGAGASASASARLVLHGGRGAGGVALSDMWAYEFGTGAWRRLAETTPAGARFGHGAASPAGVIPAAGGLPRLYLFGGVADAFGPGAAGSPNIQKGLPTGALFECDADTGACEDITYG